MSSRIDNHKRLGKQPLPPLLQWFWFSAYICAFISLVSTWIFVEFMHLDRYPWDNPLFHWPSYQADFKFYSERMKYFHQARFFHVHGQEFAYPALIAVVYKMFYLLGSYAHAMFVWTIVMAFCAGAALFGRALVRSGLRPLTAYGFAAVVLFTSYPVYLELFLANMEAVVWIMTALAIWAYVTDRSWIAAACIGIAGAMKIYPLVYLGVFLPRKQYKQFAFSILVFLGVNVISLAILGPSIPTAYHGLSEGLRAFQQEYIYSFLKPEIGMDHSLFAILKIGLLATGHLSLLRPFLSAYLAIGALAGTLLYFFKLRFLPPTNLVMSLVIASILLPPVSHAYTLLHLYAPWAMLALLVVQRGNKMPHKRAATWSMICFGILFTSQNYLIFHHGDFVLRVDGQLKAVTLLLLLIIAIRYPFEDTASRNVEQAQSAEPMLAE